METVSQHIEDLEYLESIAEKERQSRFEKALRISREETEGMTMRIQSVIEIGEEKGKSK